MKELFERHPPPWVCSDNQPDYEGQITIFDANGKPVLIIADMEDAEWVEILMGYLLAASPQMFQVLTEAVTCMEAYQLQEPELMGQMRAALLQADYTEQGRRQFPPRDPDAPPPISIIPER